MRSGGVTRRGKLVLGSFVMTVLYLFRAHALLLGSSILVMLWWAFASPDVTDEYRFLSSEESGEIINNDLNLKRR